MAQSQAQKQLQKYDADIAVLQVEFRNLDSKFDTALADVKADVKEVSLKMDKHNDSTHTMLKEFQSTNVKQHTDMAAKIAGLEKWRWMLIGAGCILGGLGYSGLSKLLLL